MKKIIFVFLFLSCVLIKLTSQEKSRPKFYVGTDVGYSGSNMNEIGYVGGVEVTPYFGIIPFKFVPGLSFEVAVQMDFIGNFPDDDLKFRFRAISPQMLTCYKFSFPFVKPYIKTGVGININSGDLVYYTSRNNIKEVIDTTNCISFVFNPGIEVSCSKYITLVGWGRFNFNVADLNSYNVKLNNLYVGTTAFGMGIKVVI